MIAQLSPGRTFVNIRLDRTLECYHTDGGGLDLYITPEDAWKLLDSLADCLQEADR